MTDKPKGMAITIVMGEKPHDESKENKKAEKKKKKGITSIAELRQLAKDKKYDEECD